MKKILRLTIVFLVLGGFSSSTWADDVTDWNQMLFRVGLVAGTNATNMSRVAAIVQASVFDAVNGIDQRYTPIHVAPAATSGASRRAAAIQAAYVILVKFYGTGGVLAPPPPAPQQQAALDARRRVALTEVATDESMASINDGVTWGQTVAEAIYLWRSTDGWNPLAPTFTGSTALGQWRQTPNLPATGTSTPGVGYPQFSNQTPWTMVSALQFRPPAPYAPTVAAALASARYAADFNETKSMGSFASANRSADQTVYALVWAAGTAGYLWNNAAVSLIEGRNRDRDEKEHKKDKHHSTLLENARLLAALDLAMADAIIGCWDAKYNAYNANNGFWRPITAIREMADDGNPLTTPDPNWMPMFATPAHPEWPSGHSCASGAAAVILGNEFGDHVKFSISSDLVPGVSREFHGVADALEEVKNARVFAGIHFRLACEVGQALGKTVAEYMLANRFQRVN